MVVNRGSGALRVLLQFLRAQEAGDPYAFRFESQNYILPTAGGDSPSARFDWTPEILADLQAVRLPGRNPDVVQRLGERLRRFVLDAGWAQHELQIVQALAEQRPIFLTIRSSAAELYALPWELLTLKTGQFIGEVDGLLLRFEWPDSTSIHEYPVPRPEGGRILVAWSAAAGAVPSAEHIQAISTACAAGFQAFHSGTAALSSVTSGLDRKPNTDVLAHASLEQIVRTLEKAQQGGPPIAVLHLLCHGVAVGSTFGLALDGKDGPVRVDAAQLRQQLAPFAKMVRLIVLAACDSGNLGLLGNHLGSVAQALHRCGFQSVIASRFPLSVASSITFTESFYSELLLGPASLETAFLAARKRLACSEINLPWERCPLDWASLQLYARNEDGDDTRPVVFRPFRGLLAFEYQHSRFLFGRDAELRKILGGLQALSDSGKPRLLVVVGASGTGKSSLVLAGAVPALLQADPSQVFRLMRPGSVPLAALREALDDLTGNLGLLVVDQFEELFTQTTDPGVHEAFVRALWRLAAGPPSGLCILVTLRIDFLGRCGDLVLDSESGLRFDRVALDPAHQIHVPQMDKVQLRAAIVEPVRLVGLEMQAGLAPRMIADVGGEPGALPMLEDALDVLWQHRDGRTLTQAAYDQLGGEPSAGKTDSQPDKGGKRSGVVGALRKRADDLLDELSLEELPIAQRLLLSLVAVAEDTALDTRRRVALDELRATCTLSDAESAGFDVVLQKLVEARLLVQDDIQRLPHVEVAHEALIRNWPRLRVWLDDDRAALLLHRKILLDAQQWDAQQRDESRLYRGTELAQMREWQKTWESRRRRLSELTQEFLQAGEALEAEVLQRKHEAEAQLAAERQQKLEAAQHLARRTLVAAAVLVLLLVIAAVAGLEARRKSIEANKNEAEAKRNAAKALQASEENRQKTLDTYIELGSQLLFTEDRPDEALLRLHRAYKAGSKNPVLLDLLREARYGVEATRTVLVGHMDRVRSATYSPDGQRIATASDDHTARVWDADTGCQLVELRGHVDRVTSATYSPDGQHIVTASDDHTARIWDAGTGRPVAVLTGHGARVWNAMYSPSGQRIVTASDDHTARVWDADTGRPVAVLTGHGASINNAVYRPDGRQIVTASDDNTARVWDADAGRLVAVLKGHGDKVWRATYSPDGKRIVTASWDKTAQVWESETGHNVVVLTGHGGIVLSAVYSPDGKRILTASWDKTARVWDAKTGQKLAVLTGHGGIVFSATYSPDGRRILTTSDDHRARVWDAETEQTLAVLTGHGGIVLGAAYSPDGRRILTASDDHTARVWDIDTGQKVATLTGHEDSVYSASYNPNGKRILTASRDHTARVWDAETGQKVAVLTGHEDGVNTATYSPDGTRILTASEDKTARTWEAETGRQVAMLTGHEDSVNSARYSSDGMRIVTASWDKTARVWDAETGQKVAVLTGHEASVFSAAYSPDVTRIVTASYDHTARVWDAKTGQKVAVLTGHGSGVYSAVFSPDGKRIVTASFDNTARVWDAKTGRQVAVLTGHRSGVYSAAYSLNGKRIVTASFDNTAQVWDAETGQKVAVLTGHESVVQSAMYSPDGKRIVTASWDMTARVWDVTPEMQTADQIAKLIRYKVGARFAREDSNLIIPSLPNPADCQLSPQPPLTSQ